MEKRPTQLRNERTPPRTPATRQPLPCRLALTVAGIAPLKRAEAKAQRNDNLIGSQRTTSAGIGPNHRPIGDDISRHGLDVSAIEISVAEIDGESLRQQETDPNGKLPRNAVRRSARYGSRRRRNVCRRRGFPRQTVEPVARPSHTQTDERRNA